MKVSEVNRDQKIAREINRDVRSNPDSPYAGKYLGIAGGQVVAAADTLGDLVRVTHDLGLGPDDVVCIEAGSDYEGRHDIWGSK